MAKLMRNGIEILNAVGIGNIIEESDLFYQEYSAVSTTNYQNKTLTIDLDVDEVEWLIMFPLVNDLGGQYAIAGGMYIPNTFNQTIRTSYQKSNPETLGCGVAAEGYGMSVSDGTLTIKFANQGNYIYANAEYGIVGKKVSS